MIKDRINHTFCAPPGCRCLVASKNEPCTIKIDLDNVIDIYDNEIDGLLLRVEATSAKDVIDKLVTFVEKLEGTLESGELYNYLDSVDTEG